MQQLPIAGNQKAVAVSIGAGALLIAIGVYLPTNISIFGGGVKSACSKYKEEMSLHVGENPVATGNYTSFTDPVFEEWNKKGDAINKRLFDAVGLPYSSGGNRTIEEAQKNMKGIMEAAQKCYNAGVDFGGMKELKEFSKGLN